MKVLFFVPYPTEGPSNRFRVEQYLPYLKKEGIEYSLRPFINRRIYKILYKEGFFLRKLIFFLFFTIRRARDIIDARKYDVAFIHREAYPIGRLIECLLRIFSRKMVYDFDDALFIPNVSYSNRAIEILKDVAKVQKIITMSDYVIAGNNFLKNYALRLNKAVSVIPTSIDTDKYKPAASNNPNAHLTLGWIGSTTTVKYLDMLSEVFNALFLKYDHIRLLIVGGKWNKLKSAKIHCKEWDLESEIDSLRLFDIGIMPLLDDEWSKGKCAFKIIEYMSVGIPVVASAVGMNKEVIQDGDNGFLASNSEEWLKKISLLMDDAGLRIVIGKAGRKTAEEKYSLKVNAPRFIAALKS